MSRILLLALVLGLVVRGEALAHPHVWVTVKSEVIYEADGSVSGVRHSWTFDDMFSAFATQGLDADKDGKLSREELASLAEVNVTSLKEFDYFTYPRLGGKKTTLEGAKDYWLEHKDSMLTLHFTLPLAQPAKAKSFEFDVYDPTYFVAFALADKDPITLVRAPGACQLNVTRPADAGAGVAQKLSESFFNSLDGKVDYGAQFANKVAVTCP